MDRTYIQSQHIVPRYLSGDLSVREAREFEKFCGENPDVLNSLPIPVRVKARMARKPGAELNSGDFDPAATDTSMAAAGLHDEQDDDDEPAERGFRGLPPDTRRWVVVFAMLFAIAVVGAGALWVRVGALEKQLVASQRAAKATQVRPPNSVQTYRVRTVSAQPSAPTLDIGVPNPPQMVELRVDLNESKYNQFLVTIESVKGGRIAQIRRVSRDSNKELLISINTSAFPPGDYDVQLEGYAWRGDTYPVGWIRLGMK